MLRWLKKEKIKLEEENEKHSILLKSLIEEQQKIGTKHYTYGTEYEKVEYDNKKLKEQLAFDEKAFNDAIPLVVNMHLLPIEVLRSMDTVPFLVSEENGEWSVSSGICMHCGATLSTTFSSEDQARFFALASRYMNQEFVYGSCSHCKIQHEEKEIKNV